MIVYVGRDRLLAYVAANMEARHSNWLLVGWLVGWLVDSADYQAGYYYQAVNLHTYTQRRLG